MLHCTYVPFSDSDLVRRNVNSTVPTVEVVTAFDVIHALLCQCLQPLFLSDLLV
jgi:hypothetical protein